MRLSILGAAVLAASCVALSGCAGFTVPGTTGGSTAAAQNALHEFLTDPNCAHHDEANFVTGAAGVPAAVRAKVSRDCQPRAVAPAAVVPPTTPTPPS